MRRKRKIPLSRELEPLARMIEDLGDRYDTHSVFRDFVEMSAIALAKPDLKQACAREERYLSLTRQYKNPEECQAFPKMFGGIGHGARKDRAGRAWSDFGGTQPAHQNRTGLDAAHYQLHDGEDGHRRPG